MLSEQAMDDLYWAVGDGGPPFDPNNHAQNLDTLLGSVIRITVPRNPGANDPAYAIPSGNARGNITYRSILFYSSTVLMIVIILIIVMCY